MVFDSKTRRFVLFLLFLGIIFMVVSYSVWRNNIIRRDNTRKETIKSLQKDLKKYHEKFGFFPSLSEFPLPADPVNVISYSYEVFPKDDSYKLFTRFENSRDSQVIGGLAQNCGQARCNFVVSGQ